MDRNQLPFFDPNCHAYGELGFTPLPGSQLQLQSSAQAQQTLSSNLGFNNGPNNGFDRVAMNAYEQMLQKLQTKKRASPDQFSNDTNLQLYKRQTLEGQQPGSTPTALNSTLANTPSIPSRTTWSNQAPSTCAPVLPNFSLGSGQTANGPVLNNIFLNQSNPTHVSPYEATDFQQARGLQQNPAGTENAYDTLQSRLQAAHQTINLLTEKCNRYENALRQYNTPDPKTGKLPMQMMKDEITTLRRVCSYRANRYNEMKATAQDFSDKYRNLAIKHNRFVVYFESRKGMASSNTLPPTPPTPAPSNTSASITPTAIETAAQSTPPVGKPVTLPVTPVTQPVAAPVTPQVARPGPQSVPQRIPQSVAQFAAQPVAEPVAPTIPCPVAKPVVQPATHPVAANRVDSIDLTIDDDNSSSVATVSSNGLPTEKPCGPLTSFRRNFNQKELKWLQPSHPSDAIEDMYKKLNPGEKKSRKASVEYGYGDCSNIVHTQQHVRQALGGPFDQRHAPRRPLVMPGPCKPTTPPEKKTAPVKKDQPVEKYSVTDEELARMLEEEMIRGCDKQPTNKTGQAVEQSSVTDAGLTRVLEEMARRRDEQATDNTDKLEEVGESVNDDLDDLFEEDPTKPTGDGLEDSFEKFIDAPYFCAEQPANNTDKPEEVGESVNDDLDDLFEEDPTKPTGDGLDDSFKENPAKPTDDGLEDSFEKFIDAPYFCAEQPANNTDKPEEVGESVNDDLDDLFEEDPTKPTGDGLNDLFKEDPVKPTGNSLEDLFEEFINPEVVAPPFYSAELYADLPGSEPLMTNKELVELLDKEWPHLP